MCTQNVLKSMLESMLRNSFTVDFDVRNLTDLGAEDLIYIGKAGAHPKGPRRQAYRELFRFRSLPRVLPVKKALTNSLLLRRSSVRLRSYKVLLIRLVVCLITMIIMRNMRLL